MSTGFFIVCLDCKQKRSLDNFYTLMSPIKTRKEALALSDKLEEYHSYSATLLATFLAEHSKHKFVLHCDQDAGYEEFEDDAITKGLWRPDENE